MGLPLPATLTPSKITRFVKCPLAFRYSYIDHLPEPSSIHQVRGTLVHRALELLFGADEPGDRTLVVARESLETAWHELEDTEEVGLLALSEKETREFLADASVLIDRYFTLEDPVAVRPAGVEMDLRFVLDGVEMRGIIDRLDHLDGGEYAIVDYKTGRSPRPDRARSELGGVQFYAFLCEQVIGTRPREVRLMYLRDRVVVVESPTEQSMRALYQRAFAVWHAIARACESEDFRPNPSPLCKSCAFREICPAFGGDPVTLNRAG